MAGSAASSIDDPATAPQTHNGIAPTGAARTPNSPIGKRSRDPTVFTPHCARSWVHAGGTPLGAQSSHLAVPWRDTAPHKYLTFVYIFLTMTFASLLSRPMESHSYPRKLSPG